MPDGRSAAAPDGGGEPAPSIRLLTFTWNVGNAKPDPAELHHWLPDRGGDFELIVVGTQESHLPSSPSAPAAPCQCRLRDLPGPHIHSDR